MRHIQNNNCQNIFFVGCDFNKMPFVFQIFFSLNDTELNLILVFFFLEENQNGKSTLI